MQIGQTLGTSISDPALLMQWSSESVSSVDAGAVSMMPTACKGCVGLKNDLRDSWCLNVLKEDTRTPGGGTLINTVW